MSPPQKNGPGSAAHAPEANRIMSPRQATSPSKQRSRSHKPRSTSARVTSPTGVLATAVTRCEFCNAPASAGIGFEARAFTWHVPAPNTSGLDIPAQTWHACDPCGADILAADWAALAARQQLAGYTVPSPWISEDIRSLHEQLRAALTGRICRWATRGAAA